MWKHNGQELDINTKHQISGIKYRQLEIYILILMHEIVQVGSDIYCFPAYVLGFLYMQLWSDQTPQTNLIFSIF